MLICFGNYHFCCYLYKKKVHSFKRPTHSERKSKFPFLFVVFFFDLFSFAFAAFARCERALDVNNPGAVGFLSEVISLFILKWTGKRLSPVINQIVCVINTLPPSPLPHEARGTCTTRGVARGQFVISGNGGVGWWLCSVTYVILRRRALCGSCQRLRVTCDDHLHVSPMSGQPLKDRSKSVWRSWVALADAKGAHGPIFFIFVQFSAKILPNNRFLPLTLDLVPTLPPPSGKSWIHPLARLVFLCGLLCSVSNQVAKLPVVGVKLQRDQPGQKMYILSARDEYKSQLRSSMKTRVKACYY